MHDTAPKALTLDDIQRGVRVRHRRSHQSFTVVETGWHGETGEPFVVYRGEADGKIWVSPTNVFLGWYLLIPAS
jgi:hypothetical protein